MVHELEETELPTSMPHFLHKFLFSFDIGAKVCFVDHFCQFQSLTLGSEELKAELTTEIDHWWLSNLHIVIDFMPLIFESCRFLKVWDCENLYSYLEI